MLEWGALHSFPPNPEDTPVDDELKILIVGDFPPPHGGVAVHVEELQRAIRAAGGDARVLDIGKGQLPADGVVAAGSPANFLLQLSLHAARGYRIHLHTSGANPKSWTLAGLCAAAGRAAGRPAILTLHSGLGPAWLAEAPLRAAVAGRVACGFGAVVAVSHPIARMLRLCGVPASKLEVLPAFLGAQLEVGAPPPQLDEVRRAGAPLLCAMLAPGRVYGEETLLRAFARLRAESPRAQLVLYGAGTAAPGLAARARELCGPAAGAVTGLGELSRSAALGLIAGCDLFVRPTLADGDSVSVREALALGRRVVATAVGNRPPGVFLVPAADDAALAAGICDALAAAPGAVAAGSSDTFARLLALYRAAPAAPAAPRHEDAAQVDAAAGEGRCAASPAF